MPAGLKPGSVSLPSTGEVPAETSQWNQPERLLLALAATSDGIWDWDLISNLTFFSDRYYTMLGYKPGEFEATFESWRRLVHPSELAATEKLIQAHILTGNEYNAEFRMRTRDGQWKWICSRGRVTNYDATGKPTRMAGSHIDIDARKRAEIALGQSEALFRNMLENVPNVAVQGYSPNGTVNYWNKASETIYGYTAQEALGKDLVELIISPSMRDVVRQHIGHMAKTGHPIPAGELELMRKDGSLVPVYSSHVAILLDDRTQLFCLDVDLRDRKRAEAERLEMERQLMHVQKLESLGVLAGGVAHDFNNLLTSIMGNLELAQMDLPAFSPTHECIVEAILSCRRAAELSRQMLAYSGRGKFAVKSFNLSKLVKDMSPLLAASISKAIQLKFDLTHELPAIRADASQIQQVILNLVTNASESITDHQGNIRIVTGSRQFDTETLALSRLPEKLSPGEYVFLEVCDSGCGMDEPTNEKIFEPFFSTKFAGRGLGMATVLGIVRGHHGAIMVSTTPGQGTTVRVLLPLEVVTSFNAAKPANLIQDSPANFKGRPLGTILLVDDEAQVLRVAERTLSRMGFTIITAADGLEAVQKFRENQDAINCVVLDYTMPKQDGLAAAAQILQLRPNAKLILASGFDTREARIRHGDKGIRLFIQKPYPIKDLVMAVNEVISEQL